MKLVAIVALILGFCIGWIAHPPKAEWVVDAYPGDVSIDNLMYQGKIHAHFRCPAWYKLHAEEGKQPKCRLFR